MSIFLYRLDPAWFHFVFSINHWYIQEISVETVYMQNWDLKTDLTKCTTEEDFESARRVAEHLNLPFHFCNFAKEYWNLVFMDMIEVLKSGLSPNIDVMCNKKIKFGILHKFVTQNLNADFLATGHYAQTDHREDLTLKNGKTCQMRLSNDPVKDQTFFLSHVLVNI